jgi:hypothetical protein
MEPTIISNESMKNFSRGWYLIEMHLAIFGHLPEDGDEKLTELEYAKKYLELNPVISITNLKTSVVATAIIKEHEAEK